MSVECPKCGEPLRLSAVIAPETRMSMTLHPKDGARMMEAKTIGGTLSALQGLLQVSAKSLGGQVAVFVESIDTDPVSRAITINLVALAARER